MKVPTASSNRLMMSSSTNRFSETATSAELIVCGMLAMVMIQLIDELTAISSITTAVVTPVWRRISGRSRHLTSR